MSREFVGALLQLNAEKGVPREQLVRTVEDAIQSAYRRVAPGYEDVYVRLDIDTGQMRIFRARSVVSEVEDPTTEWDLDEARQHDTNARLGDLVEYEELEPTHFGRVGAQVAGQVVRQRLREAERETLFDEFAHREGEIITGSVGPGRAERHHPRPRQGRGHPAHDGPVGDRALPHRPARQGLSCSRCAARRGARSST